MKRLKGTDQLLHFSSRSAERTMASSLDKGLWLSLIVGAVLATVDSTITADDDLKFTASQQKGFNEFKKRVTPKLEEEQLKTNIYLLRFFRYYNFNVAKAEEAILSHAKWRKANNMETILTEDFSDVENYFPMKVNGLDELDNFGRPILYQDMGDWETRKAILAGKRDRFLRWVYRNWEDARVKTDQLALQGKNVTRWLYLVDLKGLNLQTNLNPQSLAAYGGLVPTFLYQFPNSPGDILCINTPGIFELFLSIVSGISPQFRQQIEVVGSNEAEWGPKVRKLVDPAILRKKYGGNKVD